MLPYAAINNQKVVNPEKSLKTALNARREKNYCHYCTHQPSGGKVIIQGRMVGQTEGR